MRYGVDLAEQFEKAIASGVTGITLYGTPGGKWQAAEQRRSKDSSWHVFAHHDPVEALMGVLTVEGRRMVDLHAAFRRAITARA